MASNVQNEAHAAASETEAETATETDPLQLRALAVDFDYLMFKIKDHVLGLAELTSKSVASQKEMIEADYFGRQLRLDAQIEHADSVLRECTELEMLFMKLAQLQQFVDGFKERLNVLETGFSEV